MLTLSPVRPSGRVGRAVMASRIERLVIAPDAPLAERDAPWRGQIGSDARPLRHAITQCDHARNLFLEALHAFRETIAQALDDLEQAQVNVREPPAEQPRPIARLQEFLEVAEKLRHAITPEIPGAPLRRGDLLFEVEPARHR